MFVYLEDNKGNPIYNFQYVDDLYDRMLAKGVRPFVELGFSPGALATVRVQRSGSVQTVVLRQTIEGGRDWCRLLSNIV